MALEYKGKGKSARKMFVFLTPQIWLGVQQEKCPKCGLLAKASCPCFVHTQTTSKYNFDFFVPSLWATMRLGASGDVYRNKLIPSVLFLYVQEQKKHTLARNLFDIYLLYPLIHTTQKSNLQADHWIGPGGNTENMRSLHTVTSLTNEWNSTSGHWWF